jgi:large subunit ribosomal protein L28
MMAAAKRLVVVELGLTAASNCAFNVKSNCLATSLGTPSNDPLDLPARTRQVTLLFRDMKVCHITGSRAVRGSVIHRRGLAKKKGGVGRHITKMVPRIFAPNLRRQRIWVPELKKFVRVRVTARGLKTINKRGAYKALKKAGAI